MYLSINPRTLGAALALVLIVPLAMQLPRARAQVGETLSCESCLLVDLSTGKVLYERAPATPLPNASTTKMTTALVVEESASMKELVRVTAEAAAVGGGGLDLNEGEVYTIKDLLYALLLDSSNEAASALAAHVAGDIEAFVRAMNREARSLGATDTHFENPHGLDAPGHVSTATDLALIGEALLERPALAEIVATPSVAISVPGGTTVVENRNLLLEGYRGALGVKTGRTLGAGEVLVAAARRGPRFLIAVAMRSVDAAADARRLLDLGFEKLKRAAERARERAAREAARPDVLVHAEQEVGELVFDPGGATAVLAAQEVTGEVGEGEVKISYVPAERIPLPIADGQEVGTVEVMSDGALIGSAPAVASTAVSAERSSWQERALSGLLRTAAVIAAGVSA